MAARSGQQGSSLPAELTSFVGRHHDLAAVRRLFSVTRLVTLTGIGGVGKTRLALRAADDMRRAFPDGCYLVELASLSDPGLLTQTVLDSVGIPDAPALSPAATLIQYLRSRNLMLIFDNCEHLIEATAPLASEILTQAPLVHIITTSRQALMVAGEHTYPVSPLLAPVPESVQPGDAAHYPSVELFADRAAAVVPGFRVTAENEADVIRLCNRLEGIPLAIELAAVRMRVLTVKELADRLDDRFALLREGTRDLPRRHQTLQSLIDWSYDLCTPEQQRLWSRSSVFANSFALDALSAVCLSDSEASPGLLDNVAALVDKSILIREEHGHMVRFRMLEMVREYGQARLAETADGEIVARRHRDWYADLVATVGRDWAGPKQQEWMARLELEWPNIRQALEYSMTHPGEEVVGLRMASVQWVWAATDHLNEARLWLDRGLALATDPTPERAWALGSVGYIAAVQGDEIGLKSLPDQAKALAEQLGDSKSLALAYHALAFRQSVTKGPARRQAIALFKRAIELYTETGLAPQFVDAVLVDLAAAHIGLHEFDEAAALAEELYEHSTASGEQWNLSYALWLRGTLALYRDSPHPAEATLLEALRIKRSYRDMLGIALTLEVLARAAAALGQAERAATLIGGADRVWHTVGDRKLFGGRQPYEAMSRKALGDAAFDAAATRGSSMSVDQIVSFALGESGAASGQPSDQLDATPLTQREREVARLVASGLSNKEIAAKLVISLRTAEGHVENILSKLGFNSRTQIASWVTEHAVRPHPPNV